MKYTLQNKPVLFLFLILAFSFLPCQAKFSFTEKNIEVYKLVLELKIAEAENTLKECEEEDPTNGINVYMADVICAVKLFASDDPFAYALAKTLERKHLSQLKSLEKDSPYNLFIQSEIKLHWAALKFRFRDEIEAALDIRQANLLVAENRKRFPDFVLNNKTSGILNILLGNAPDAYQSTLKIVGMGGSVPVGLAQLQKVSQAESPFQQECKLLLLIAKSYILKDHDSVADELNGMMATDKQNMLFQLLSAGMLLTSNDATHARTLLLNLPKESSMIDFPLVHKMLADSYMYHCEYEKAKENYQLFLRTYKGKHYLKDTYYKLYLCHWLEDDSLKANTYLVKIMKHGYAVLESDKRADRFVHRKDHYNPVLTKSRLLFDGGYYLEAQQCLESFKLDSKTSQRDRVEYYYRKGRISHAQKKPKEAIVFYQQALKVNGTMDEYYFAPSAALQLGYIFMDNKEKEAAQKYFKFALRFKNYEYHNSISYKAKNALKKLEKF